MARTSTSSDPLLRQAATALALAGVVLAVMAALAWLVVTAFRNERRLLDTELAALAPFDAATVRAAAEREAAEQLGCALPPPPPTATGEEIARRVDAEVHRLTREKFPHQKFSDQMLAINRKYTSARIGDQVTFQIIPANRGVTGTYKGRETGLHWVFILVGLEKFPLADIEPEYHHLFDEGVAAHRAETEIAALKQDFNSRREAFAQEQQRVLTDQFFRAANYLPTAGGWHPLCDLHAERAALLFRDKERAFAAARLDEIKRLLDRHRLLGIFQVNPTVPVDAAPPSGPTTSPHRARPAAPAAAEEPHAAG